MNKEIKEEIQKYLDINENGSIKFPKSMGISKRTSKREICGDTGLHHKKLEKPQK